MAGTAAWASFAFGSDYARLAKAAAEIDGLNKQAGKLRSERDAATKAGAEVEALRAHAEALRFEVSEVRIASNEERTALRTDAAHLEAALERARARSAVAKTTEEGLALRA